MGRTWQRLWPFAALAVLCTGFVVFRAAPLWSKVFAQPGETRLLGVDSYYHLRHIAFTAEHFPRLQRWDIATGYPGGQYSDAIGLFTLTHAAAAVLLGAGSPGDQLIAQVAAWSGPALGVGVMLALYWLCRTLRMSPVAALAACAIYVFYPGASLARTSLGFADHHAAELLLALLTVGGLVRCLQAGESDKPPSWWRPAVLSSAPFAMFVFTWHGAPMYLILVGAMMLAVATVDIKHDRPARPLITVCFRYGMGLLITTGLVGWLLPTLLINESLWRKTLLGAIVLAVGPGLYMLAGRAAIRRGLKPWGAAVVCMLLAVLLGAAFLAVEPEYRELARALTSPKSQIVAEHRAFTSGIFWFELGPPGLIGLLALPVGLVAAWRDSRHRFALAALLAGAMITALSLRTYDYDYMPPAFFAMMAMWLVCRFFAGLLANWSIGERAMMGSVLTVAAVMPLWPLGWVQVF